MPLLTKISNSYIFVCEPLHFFNISEDILNLLLFLESKHFILGKDTSPRIIAHRKQISFMFFARLNSKKSDAKLPQVRSKDKTLYHKIYFKNCRDNDLIMALKAINSLNGREFLSRGNLIKWYRK